MSPICSKWQPPTPPIVIRPVAKTTSQYVALLYSSQQNTTIRIFWKSTAVLKRQVRLYKPLLRIFRVRELFFSPSVRSLNTKGVVYNWFDNTARHTHLNMQKVEVVLMYMLYAVVEPKLCIYVQECSKSKNCRDVVL